MRVDLHASEACGRATVRQLIRSCANQIAERLLGLIVPAHRVQRIGSVVHREWALWRNAEGTLEAGQRRGESLAVVQFESSVDERQAIVFTSSDQLIFGSHGGIRFLSVRRGGKFGICSQG